MTAVPRSQQKRISFRSDLAFELLAILTRDGRSRAEVIEDALRRAAIEANILDTP